jgi:predicted nucleic acid-binding protein
MAVLFIDSSALVKRYRSEAGSRRVADLLHAAERLVVSRLTKVEVCSALVRRVDGSNVPAAILAAALAAFEDDLRLSFDIVELDEPIMDKAVILAQKHALRAADSIQLACALLSRPEPRAGSKFYLVSADDELNTAALAEGLSVENPNSHP